MGATVDSSAHTSSIRKVLFLGGRGLRLTISTMPASFTVRACNRIAAFQRAGSPPVLCVTASVSGIFAKRLHLHQLPTYAMFDAAFAGKVPAQLSHVC